MVLRFYPLKGAVQKGQSFKTSLISIFDICDLKKAFMKAQKYLKKFAKIKVNVIHFES